MMISGITNASAQLLSYFDFFFNLKFKKFVAKHVAKNENKYE